MIVIATQDAPALFDNLTLPAEIVVVDSAALIIRRLIDTANANEETSNKAIHRTIVP
jgi:hypothetical protein